MSLSTGQVLNNRYRIDALTGEGGFGAVYRAWDTVLNRTCAVKENLDTSPAAVDQFQREAVILASLKHPSLPEVTDHFIIPGQGQYLVMDFVEGQSLAEVIRERRGRLSEAEALPWIEEICDALIYLHSQIRPIIHRDVKPQNIIITPAGQAMLVDFGISKVFDESMRTRTGSQAVTTGFSPPEQYGMGTTDARSDVYALGATLYTALTGQVPPDAIERVAEDAALVPPSKLNPGVSLATQAAILKAMDPHATQRFQTAQQLGQALKGGALPGAAAASPEPAAEAPTLRTTGKPGAAIAQMGQAPGGGSLSGAAAGSGEPAAEAPTVRAPYEPIAAMPTARVPGDLAPARPVRAARSGLLLGVVAGLLLIGAAALAFTGHLSLKGLPALGGAQAESTGSASLPGGTPAAGATLAQAIPTASPAAGAGTGSYGQGGTPTPSLPKAVFWQRYDVDIAIEKSGDFRVRETQGLVFTGGLFSWGEQNIDLVRLSDITGITVREENGPVYTQSSGGAPFTFSVSTQYDTSRGVNQRAIRYHFPPSENMLRTIIIAYTVSGALRYYPQNGVDQLYWKAIGVSNGQRVQSSTITLHAPPGATFTNYGIYGASRRATFRKGQTSATIVVNGPLNAGADVEAVAEWPHGIVGGSAQPWQQAIDAQSNAMSVAEYQAFRSVERPTHGQRCGGHATSSQ